MFDDDKNINYAVKNFKETFSKSGRLDSEYYQVKYDNLFEKILCFKTKKLSNIVSINKSIEPGSDNYNTDGIPFIRVQDLAEFEITKPSVYLDRKKYSKAIKPKKDTILLSKDGTVGIAYKMNDDRNIITSSAILHLNIKDDSVMPDYLTLLLNSIVVKVQAERDAGGSIINHWKKSEIENVIIPIISMEKQQKISKLLKESTRLRNDSLNTLEKAIKAVELSIEQGENKAISFLN